MKKGHTIYVSCASSDGGSGTKGWIDQFIVYLGIFYNRLTGHQATITSSIALKDKKDRDAAAASAEVVIPIINEAFLKDANCKKEFETWANEKDYSKLYKVISEPLSASNRIKWLDGENEYRFFGLDEYSDSYTEKTYDIDSRNFWFKVFDITFDMLFLRANKGSNGHSSDPDKAVYLAETSIDQIRNRDMIKRELQRYGYTVFPDHPLPSSSKKAQPEIKNYLSKSKLAIHLVGNVYGDAVEDEDASITEIQNNVAAEYCDADLSEADKNFYRLIWMPTNVKPENDRQKLHLDSIRENIDRLKKAEIVQTPLEALKTIVHERLRDYLLEDFKAKEKKNKVGNLVYVIHNPGTSEIANSVQSILEKSNSTVIRPDFEGNQISVLDKHRDNLVMAEAIVIIVNENYNWFNSMLNDIIKSPGFGRRAPFKSIAVMSLNKKITKDQLNHLENSELIQLKDNKITEDILKPVLSKLK